MNGRTTRWQNFLAAPPPGGRCAKKQGEVGAWRIPQFRMLRQIGPRFGASAPRSAPSQVVICRRILSRPSAIIHPPRSLAGRRRPPFLAQPSVARLSRWYASPPNGDRAAHIQHFLSWYERSMALGRKWSKPETLAAFCVYLRLPFGKLHSKTPEIIELAAALNRTPSSVAMKCCNISSLDDQHRRRGVVGLQKSANVEREIWQEFQDDPESVSFNAASALATLKGKPVEETDDDNIEPVPLVGLDRESLVRVRVNQRLFRAMILAGYREMCAVCELPIHSLLVASHIVPWSCDPSLRMRPDNGLCLCGTHDRAFETGLLRIGEDRIIRCSDRLAKYSKSESANQWLIRFDGAPISLPERWPPGAEFLRRRIELLGQ